MKIRIKDSNDNILHSIKKHKQCMTRGVFSIDSTESFSKRLAETLEITTESIKDYYKFGKTIGIGQYGIVKEAFSLANKTEMVAVKILDLDTISKTFKSICGEVSSLKQADHPNIIKLLKVFMDSEHLYLVFEFVDGIDLSDYITENIRISEENTKIILTQICSTIEYLHSIHIGHRDIKLDNIMINQKTLEIKLIDFGFATKCSDRTRLKGKIGTPYYVAPEVITGTYGKECDMWSTGIMTYFMLVGDPPFNAESDNELFENITTNQIYYNPKDWKLISSEGKDFVKRLLCKNPEKRMKAKEAVLHPWISENSTLQR